MTLQVHLFSDSGPLSATYESVQNMANAFLSEQGVCREELVSCQLAIAGGNSWSEVALLLVVDVEEGISERDLDAIYEAAGVASFDHPDTPPGALGNINRHDEESQEEGI